MDDATLKLTMAFAAALLVGFTKTGVPGLGMLVVPLLAAAFGSKASAGVMLPMLLFGDFFAVAYYKRHADWSIILRLLPWVVAGIGVGVIVLWKISETALTPVFGVIILSMVALKLAQDRGGQWFERRLPRAWWFSAGAGFLAGFTTAIGNLAGSIMSIYFLSMGLDKRRFMGTGAWFYLIVNALKFPLFIFISVITPDSLLFNLKAVPLILVGIVVGIYAFRAIPQAWFDRVIIILALLAGARMLWTGAAALTTGASPSVLNPPRIESTMPAPSAHDQAGQGSAARRPGNPPAHFSLPPRENPPHAPLFVRPLCKICRGARARYDALALLAVLPVKTDSSPG